LICLRLRYSNHPHSSSFISSFKTEYSYPHNKILSFIFTSPTSIILYTSLLPNYQLAGPTRQPPSPFISQPTHPTPYSPSCAPGPSAVGWDGARGRRRRPRIPAPLPPNLRRGSPPTGATGSNSGSQHPSSPAPAGGLRSGRQRISPPRCSLPTIHAMMTPRSSLQ
jgi:hypothetical protein